MKTINDYLRKGRKSKSKLYKRYINWFIKHYFCCDIKCETQIADTVVFVHGGLGCVIHPNAIIEDNVRILQGVTLGVRNLGGRLEVPHIGKNCLIGAGAILLGGITIGENTKIGAGAVVVKDVPANCTVVGNPARIIYHGGGGLIDSVKRFFRLEHYQNENFNCQQISLY